MGEGATSSSGPRALWIKKQTYFFRRNPPEPDQARESFLLKMILCFQPARRHAAAHQPAHPLARPAAPPAGQTARWPARRPAPSPAAGRPVCLAALPPTSRTARVPADQGAAPCKILELLHHGWAQVGSGKVGSGFAKTCVQVGHVRTLGAHWKLPFTRWACVRKGTKV